MSYETCETIGCEYSAVATARWKTSAMRTWRAATARSAPRSSNAPAMT